MSERDPSSWQFKWQPVPFSERLGSAIDPLKQQHVLRAHPAAGQDTTQGLRSTCTRPALCWVRTHLRIHSKQSENR